MIDERCSELDATRGSLEIGIWESPSLAWSLGLLDPEKCGTIRTPNRLLSTSGSRLAKLRLVGGWQSWQLNSCRADKKLSGEHDGSRVTGRRARLPPIGISHSSNVLSRSPFVRSLTSLGGECQVSEVPNAGPVPCW